jgi:serine protease Do
MKNRAFASLLQGILVSGLVILLALLGAGCATVGGGAQQSVIRAKDKVAPALVHIRPVKEVYSRGKREEVMVVGSGFIISEDGYVVTNEHVAGESKLVRCVLSNKEDVEAEVIGVDPYTDLALLKLKKEGPFPWVKLGDSDALEAGQMVLALGSPHGLARSVSMGIVSVTDRHLGGSGPRQSPFNNWIQTDAAINPGNSGGPLVNLKGEVIGVNTRVLSGAENVGFAIPVNIAKDVVDNLLEHGRVPRSRIGLFFQELLSKTEDPKQKGVIVASVDPLSPAADAQIMPGDILLSINGIETNARFEENLPALRKLIADLPIGEEVRLVLHRGDERILAHVFTEERSEVKGNELEFSDWGFTATELTPEIVRRVQLASNKGVLISGTQVGSIARTAGLTAGDIVLAMDAEIVEGLGHFKRLYDKRVEEETPLTMLWVKNRALTRFVLIKQEEDTTAQPQEGSENEK